MDFNDPRTDESKALDALLERQRAMPALLSDAARAKHFDASKLEALDAEHKTLPDKIRAARIAVARRVVADAEAALYAANADAAIERDGHGERLESANERVRLAREELHAAELHMRNFDGPLRAAEHMAQTRADELREARAALEALIRSLYTDERPARDAMRDELRPYLTTTRDG